MEYKDWLNQLSSCLEEYGYGYEEGWQIINDKEEEICLAFSKQASVEITAYNIGKGEVDAQMKKKANDTYERYSAYHPKIFSVQYCLDTMINRSNVLHEYLEKSRSEASAVYPPNHETDSGLKICEESYDTDISVSSDTQFSSLVRTLICRLNATKDKILIVSFLRSKYSILYEILSMCSRIPQVIIETGFNNEMTEQKWDDLSNAVNPLLNNDLLFLMDYSEPIGLDEFVDDLRKAQAKGSFNVIVVSGLSYLPASQKGGLHEATRDLLTELTDDFGVNVLVFL